MKTFAKFLLFSLAALMVISCNKKNENPIETIPQQIDYFPNTIGYQWTYSVYDSTLQQSDTLTVTIVGQTILSNGDKANIWQYKDSGKTDTNYVTRHADTIRFYYNYLPDLILKDIFVFPFIVGKYWHGINSFDTCKIIADKNIQVYAGDFNAMELEKKLTGPNYFLYENIWFAQVGIVKIYKEEFNFAPVTKTTWELIKYNIGQSKIQ